ncbi:MAG TPA: mechanosensitive ion channel family protein [Candidatus Gastranaerophilales bacterium]|nr:mechanosensitive ion channel family protein [Candidatus Gastranaerophilales bacterium]
MQNYIQFLSVWFVNKGIPILFIITISIILLKIINLFLEEYFNRIIRIKDDEELEKRLNTLKLTLKSIIDLVIIAVSFTIALSKLGIEIGPILAAAGVLGIAVGFGAQRVVEDIIMGFFILVEDQIRVGDVVQIGDKSGTAEKVDLKMVVLRDFSGNVHYIRNGKIDIITNMTRDYSYYVFDIGIPYQENIDSAIDIVKQIGKEFINDDNFKDDILEPVEISGIDRLDKSVITIKGRIKTKPAQKWLIGREFNYRLKKKFDEHKKEVLFSHDTTEMGRV